MAGREIGKKERGGERLSDSAITSATLATCGTCIESEVMSAKDVARGSIEAQFCCSAYQPCLLVSLRVGRSATLCEHELRWFLASPPSDPALAQGWTTPHNNHNITPSSNVSHLVGTNFA